MAKFVQRFHWLSCSGWSLYQSSSMRQCCSPCGNAPATAVVAVAPRPTARPTRPAPMKPAVEAMPSTTCWPKVPASAGSVLKAPSTARRRRSQ